MDYRAQMNYNKREGELTSHCMSSVDNKLKEEYWQCQKRCL